MSAPAPSLARGCYLRDFPPLADRKSTRLNSSHLVISYAVFCLKKKKPRVLRTAHYVLEELCPPRRGVWYWIFHQDHSACCLDDSIVRYFALSSYVSDRHHEPLR